jgi:hypothetical protein
MLGKMNSIIQVTPIWRSSLTPMEHANVTQTLLNSQSVQVEFLAPRSLDVSRYQYQYPSVQIRRIEDYHLASIASYNRLMLSKYFYEAYLQFEYVAIVQTDAFVRKSLTSIPDFAFDYLGAPWNEGVLYRSINGHLFVAQPTGTRRREIRRLAFKVLGRQVFVGNGGLSLRNVEQFRRFVEDYEILNMGYLQQGINEDIIISTVGSERGIRIAGSALAGAVFQEQVTREQAVAADLWGVHAPSSE